MKNPTVLFARAMSLLAACTAPAAALNADKVGQAGLAVSNPHVLLFTMTILLFGVAVYFSPTFIAGLRQLEQFPLVFLVNLLFGWTIIGWVIAFGWSLRPRVAPIKEEPRAMPDRRRAGY